MTAVREGQTFDGRSLLVRYVNFVKLPHTVFALPFALVGATLASYVSVVTPALLGWIVLAFTAARFAAMGFNRIVDREIDAVNPRTASREIPSGALSVWAAGVAVVIASGLFLFASYRINSLCFLLAPLALGWVMLYSYTKRFTRLSHVVLGIGLAIAPVGGYLAVTGAWSAPWWLLVALASAVAAWVAGFDILYSLQDVEFDRSQRLYSIPAAVGERRALTLSRGLHVVAVLALVAAGIAAGAGLAYWVGAGVVAVLLGYEHSLVHAGDLSKLDAAFFTMNGVISIAFFGFVLLERMLA